VAWSGALTFLLLKKLPDLFLWPEEASFPKGLDLKIYPKELLRFRQNHPLKLRYAQ